MCVDSVDQINGVIPFRLTPVKLASLVYRGNIQGATSECSNRVRVCDRVWQASKRRPLSPLTPLTLYWAGMGGMDREGQRDGVKEVQTRSESAGSQSDGLPEATGQQCDIKGQFSCNASSRRLSRRALRQPSPSHVTASAQYPARPSRLDRTVLAACH